MASDPLSTLVVLGATGMSGIVSLAIAAIGWRDRVEQAQTVAGWPRARGRIVESEVRLHRDSDGSQYEPRVRYSYEVAGKQFQGQRLRVGAGTLYTGDRGVAEAMIAPYWIGATVHLYVDPDDAAQAVLEARASTARVGAWLAVGVALLVTTMFMIAQI